MGKKLDYKKAYRELYLPGTKPGFVDVPPMRFIMVDGKGEPGGAAYQASIKTLYTLTLTIKMSKMPGRQPDGYFEYVVPPLEGFWWFHSGKLDFSVPKEISKALINKVYSAYCL